MKAWRHMWLAVVLAWTVTGCAGGSGSSGFDIRENLAIEDALGSGDCQDFEGVRICPADTGAPVQPTMAPTARPTPTFTPSLPLRSRTPTVAIDSPGPVTGTPTPSGPSSTATATVTLTPHPTEAISPQPTLKPTPPMEVDTNLGGSTDIVCFPENTEKCTVEFKFAASGFPVDAVFRTAVRESDDQPWSISQPTAVDVQPGQEAFEDAVQVGAPVDPAASKAQFAVLVFLIDPGPLPPTVRYLSDANPDAVYVLDEKPLSSVEGTL